MKYLPSQNLKLTQPNPKLSFLGLGLVFWLGLGFVLVVFSAWQKYRWLIFLVEPVVI